MSYHDSLMSAEYQEKNIFGGKCQGTENKDICLTRIVIKKYLASLDKSSPIPADRTIAKDIIDSKPTCATLKIQKMKYFL